MRPFIIMCMLSFPAAETFTLCMLCYSVELIDASAEDSEVYSCIAGSQRHAGCVQFASTVKLFIGVRLSSVGAETKPSCNDTTLAVKKNISLSVEQHYQFHIQLSHCCSYHHQLQHS